METLDMFYPTIFVDSCALYPPLEEEKSAMERLWELFEKEAIPLQFAEATDEEIQKAPLKIRNMIHNSKMCKMDWKDMMGREERIKFAEIKEILFPHKKILSDNEKRDVRNLFCANKYCCRIFVTLDKKHILNKTDLIEQRLNLKAVTPVQCLKLLLDRIAWIERHTEIKKNLSLGAIKK